MKISFSILIILFCFKIQALQYVERILIPVGAEKIITVPSNGSIKIQNNQILSVSDFGGKLKIKAKSIGKSIIILSDKSIEILIIPLQLVNASNSILNYLKNIKGIDINLYKQKISLEGRLHRLDDWVDMKELNVNEYFVKWSMDETLHRLAQNYFDELLTKNGLANQKILFAPNARIILGSNQLLKRYKDVLDDYGIEVLVDNTVLDLAPLIRVSITVAEVKRDFSRSIGIAWPGSYQAQLLKNGTVNGSDIDFAIQAMEQNGYGKILATPTLLAKSEKEAEFIAGGEFPIKVMSLKFQDVVWKKYGVILKIKPKADYKGHMSIDLTTEISTIDNSHTVDGVPGLLTNRIQSHFNLRESKTIALSGLIKSEQGKSTEGIPWLSRIPIFGALFSSNDFRENKTELIIFVKPEIVNENDENPKIPGDE